MLATHMSAEQKYTSYRDEVRKHVKKSLPYDDSNHIILSDLDSKAINQSRLWGNIPERKVDFNWEDDHKLFKKRYPKRFELAIWCQGRLESLSLGRPSFNDSRVRLELIERVAVNSMLKGRAFLITELALIAYANLLGAEEIRIMSPINEDVKNYYVRRGYHYVSSSGARNFPDYCVRKL